MAARDKAALEKQIAARKLDRLYLFVGEDVKLMDRMVDAVEGTVDPADRPFAVERLYAGEASAGPVEIVSSARVLPMLGDRRLVFVLRAERLLKPKRAAKADVDGDADTPGDEPIEAEALEEYLKSPVDFTTLVFVATDIDRGRRLSKLLLKQATVVEFGGLASAGGMSRGDGRPTASSWFQEELTRAGKKIDQDASRYLAARAGHDISKLRGDLERLLLFVADRPKISLDDVMEVVAEDLSVDDEWAVVNAIANGDPARALSEVGRRLDRGDSVHALVGQLRWWVSSKLAEGDASRVKPALEALLRTDLALKSSGGEERVLVERLVAELTGRPLGGSRGGWGGR